MRDPVKVEKKAKLYSDGSNQGDVLGTFDCPPVSEQWLCSFSTKQECYGPTRRDVGSNAGSAPNRGPDDIEPFTFFAQERRLYEELFHCYPTKAVYDFTPGHAVYDFTPGHAMFTPANDINWSVCGVWV